MKMSFIKPFYTAFITPLTAAYFPISKLSSSVNSSNLLPKKKRKIEIGKLVLLSFELFLILSLREKYPNTELFLVQTQENTDQK